MAERRVRKRFWLASLTGTVGGVLFLLTLISPEWIEEIFHVEPDGGNGTMEVAIVVALLAVTVVSAVFARHEWTHPLLEGASDR